MIYRRASSPLHAARASVAGLWCVAIGTAALLFDHPVVLAALLLACVLSGVLARVGRALTLTLAIAVPFALVIAVVNVLVVRDGLTVIARLGTVPVFGQLDLTAEAAAYGGILGLRALVLLLASMLFSRCVDPDEVLRGFRRISYRSAVTAALATRLLPVLARDARRFNAAQRARAGTPAPKLAIVRAVAGNALDLSVDVAATLEVRGYGAARRPGKRLRAPWSRHDIAFCTAALALLGGCIAARAGGVGSFEAYPALTLDSDGVLWLLAGLIVVVALLPFADRRGLR